VFEPDAADIATLVAAALLAALLAGWSWRNARRCSQQLKDVERRLCVVEDQRRELPAVRLDFDYDTKLQVARLYVTNLGPRSEFWASVAVYGELTSPVDRPMFGRWTHTNQPSIRLECGQRGILSLAHLDLSFPFACWHVHFTDASGAPMDLASAHTSVIGGTPSPDEPLLMIQITVSSRERATGIPHVVVLRPFSAASMSDGRWGAEVAIS
jgi:hypothetical protein